MSTLATRFFALLFSRPSTTKVVLWSLSLHSTVFAVTYALWLNLSVPFPFSQTVAFDGNRHAVEIETPFSEILSEQGIETVPELEAEVVLELQPDLLPVDTYELPPLECALTVAPPTLHQPSQSPRPEARISTPEMEEPLAGVEEIMPPDLTGNQPPRYPAEAIRQRLEGTVLLRVHLGVSGDVERVEIVRSSGHAILDRSAVKAVNKWHVRPAKQGDVPLATVEILPIRFRL